MSVRRPPKQPGSSNGTLRKCLVVLPSITTFAIALYWVIRDRSPEAFVALVSSFSGLQGIYMLYGIH